MRGSLGYGAAGLGIAVAMYRGAGAVLAPIAGRLTDVVGPKASLRAAAGLASLSALGIGLLTQGLVFLTVFLAVAGAANVLGQTASNLSLTESVRTEHLGTAFGLKQSAPPVASLIAGALVPLLGLTVGWRWAFAAAVAAAVAVGIVAPRGATARSRKALDVQRTTLRRTPLLLLAGGNFCAMAAASTLSVFTVDSAVSAGVAPAWAGLLLTLGSICAVGTRLTSGIVADRRGRAHIRAAARTIVVGVLGFVFLAVGSTWSMSVGALIAFGGGWGFNGLFWLAIVRLNPGSPGRVTGLVMPGGMLGGMLGPLSFGWLVDSVGYHWAWLVAAVEALVGAFIMMASIRVISTASRAADRGDPAPPNDHAM